MSQRQIDIFSVFNTDPELIIDSVKQNDNFVRPILQAFENNPELMLKDIRYYGLILCIFPTLILVQGLCYKNN